MIATLDTIPADNTLERYVLGIALGGGDKAVMDLEGILKPSDFFTPEHGEIYEALLTMLHQGRPLEIASVVTEFRRTGLMARIGQDKGDAGGADYLRELFDAYGFATTSLAYYAGELRAKSRLRALVTLGNHMTAAAKTPGADTGELVKEYQQTLYDLGRDGTGPSEVVSASEAVQESVARADRIAGVWR